MLDAFVPDFFITLVDAIRCFEGAIFEVMSKFAEGS